jgi:protein ImuA
MNALVKKVLRRPDTWQGKASKKTCGYIKSKLSSGYDKLDAQLSNGGWPLGNTVELLSDGGGLGAMGLFLPAMKTLSEQGRWQAFISPPCTPYGPLLAARGIDIKQVLLVHPQNNKDLLWSTEQALRSSTCSIVFSWLPIDVGYIDLRRLQIAATETDVLGVLIRPKLGAKQHSPATLRLTLPEYRKIQIFKQRGGKQQLTINLPIEDDIPEQPQLWELPAYPDTDSNSQSVFSNR